MTQIKQKRVKLDNGKTVIVDVPVNQNGKDPFKEALGMMRGIKNLQPCD
jgi:hypothetical protein